MENEIKVIKEIASIASAYIKDLLILNRTIVTLTQEKIPFDNFMALYNKYTETIKYEDKLRREGKPINVMNIAGNSIPVRDLMVELKCNLVAQKANSIALNDSEIDELVGYIKESIEKYGLGDTPCSLIENFFIRGVLRRLRDDMSENLSTEIVEIYKRVNDFMAYFYCDEEIGVQTRISGRIEIGYDSLFKITNNFGKTICNFNNEGVNEILEEVDNNTRWLTSFLSIIERESNFNEESQKGHKKS